MLKPRIIPCLDVKNGRVVKGVNFENLTDAGDPVAQAQYYYQAKADELCFLDISATQENRQNMFDMVKKVASTCFIPFTVGGGIKEMSDFLTLMRCGADKVSINSSAISNPSLISQAANKFGSQCVVVAIDSRQIDGADWVHTHGGRKETALQTKAWAKELADRGAGEILLTSMDHDGTKAGFALELTASISGALPIPVIASGGAGSMLHFKEVFTSGKADAALAASIFHFKEIGIPELKMYLSDEGVVVRK